MNLADRARATQRTFDAFRGHPFDWRHASCAHLLAAHLVNMGRDVPPVPMMNSKKDARAALKAMGAPSLLRLPVVLGLEKIVPASMWIGDVAILPGEGGRVDGIRGAIVIAAGNGKFMGWHDASEGLQMMHDVMTHVKAAFRV